MPVAREQIALGSGQALRGRFLADREAGGGDRHGQIDARLALPRDAPDGGAEGQLVAQRQPARRRDLPDADRREALQGPQAIDGGADRIAGEGLAGEIADRGPHLRLVAQRRIRGDLHRGHHRRLGRGGTPEGREQDDSREEAPRATTDHGAAHRKRKRNTTSAP